MNDKEPKVLQDSPNCEHLWLDYEPGPCPVCAEIESKIAMHEEAIENLNQIIEAKDAEIKAAEDKRGEEVLELALRTMMNAKRGAELRQAYQERFRHEQG